jgi:hypothetical protein
LNSKADGEVIIECILICLSFIGRWTAIDKILAAVRRGWRRIRPEWLTDFRKKVKRRREERVSRKSASSAMTVAQGAVRTEKTTTQDKTTSWREARRQLSLQNREEPAVIQILSDNSPEVAKAWRRGSAGRINKDS